MSRAEYEAMTRTERVQPTLKGLDMKHVTVPPDPKAFRAAGAGSLFVEFDVVDAHVSPGGSPGWLVIYGPNSTLGRLDTRKGLTVAALPRVENIAIMETN